MIIYKVTNILNSKIYIGLTSKSLRKRKKEHIYDAFKRNSNLAFHNALKKYGEDNFNWEIIDTANDEQELHEKEIYWIAHYNSYLHNDNSNGYNLSFGGEGSGGHKQSEETRNKMSEIRKTNGISKGSNNPNSKLKENDVLLIKELIKKGISPVEIAEKFNVDKSTISDIKRGKNWAHIGEDLSEFNHPRLKEDDVKEIKLLLKQGIKQSEIAKKYNVSPASICGIKNGKKWAHVEIE